jgi:AraC-like DNA-binding protein
MFYAFGAFTAFFLSLIVLTKRGRVLHDFVLGLWLVVIGLHLGLYYLAVADDPMRYPHLLGAGTPFPFFHGPLLYLYIQARTKPESFQRTYWLLHLALPLAVIVSIVPFMLLSAEQKITVFMNDGKGYEQYMTVLAWAMRASGVIYVIITYFLLQNFKKSPARDKTDFNWLRFLFYGMTVLWFVIIFIQNDSHIFPAATLFIFLIGYLGIKQAGVFSNRASEPVSTLTDDSELELAEKKKYEKSGLNDETARELHERLTRMMVQEKPYLNPELALNDLADHLETHSNYLSQVINELEGVTFYDYINALRVQEFISRVKEPSNQRFTLIALAFDCGFNSKTTFNRNFKKITGQTPSAYLSDMNIQMDA